MIDAQRRRALVIGVGSFDRPELSGEPDLAVEQFDDLEFAVPYAKRLAGTLWGYRRGGFDVTALLDPDCEGIRIAVRELLGDRAATARLVHVIGHGRPSRQRDRVEVVGRCLTTNLALENSAIVALGTSTRPATRGPAAATGRCSAPTPP